MKKTRISDFLNVGADTMTGANVRIWMIIQGLKPKDLSTGHGCKASFITGFLKGEKTSQPLVDYLVEKGCPSENFKNGRVTL